MAPTCEGSIRIVQGVGGVDVAPPLVGVTVTVAVPPNPGGVMVANVGGVEVPAGFGGVAVANGLGGVAVMNGLGGVAVAGAPEVGAVVGRLVGCPSGASVGTSDGSVACGCGVEVTITIGNVNVGNGTGTRVGGRVTRVGVAPAGGRRVVVGGGGVAVG